MSVADEIYSSQLKGNDDVNDLNLSRCTLGQFFSIVYDRLKFEWGLKCLVNDFFKIMIKNIPPKNLNQLHSFTFTNINGVQIKCRI